ncbi:MAG: TMEM175 family protein [Chthoniobacterales bacterium]
MSAAIKALILSGAVVSGIHSGMARVPSNNLQGDLPGFRLRGREVTRLEGFSDAVFGFALTLLVVSLDVPRTFNDLMESMRGFPSFAVCFLLLALIWNSHNNYCRRYGLDDTTTRVLTCVLLFLVLFYVYPLKFLFNVSVSGLIFGVSPTALNLTRDQISLLLVIYGLGFAAVYLAIFFLYLHAWRLRELLELDELERADTRYQLRKMLMFVAIGLIAAALSSSRRTLGLSGLPYLLIFPVMRVHRFAHRRKLAPLRARDPAR